MAASLEEQILDVVVTKLATITTGNGYQQTVLAANVKRPPEAISTFKATDCPGVSVRFEDKDCRYHLRDAEEFVLRVNLQVAATSDVLLRALVADVKKLIYANLVWNNGSANLARRTWIVEDGPHETEVDEGVVSASIHFSILARAALSDPTTVKAI